MPITDQHRRDLRDPLLLRDATLPDGRRANVLVTGGVIAAIRAAGAGELEPEETAASVIDLGGALLTPAFVDGHIHLDKAFVGVPWRPHEPREQHIAGRVDAERTALKEIDAQLPIAERAQLLLHQVAEYGTGYLRTHVDVHPEDGLARLEAVVAARDRCRALADVEIVAFPQRGVLASPGTAELLEQALAAGAEVIGGLDPASFDGDVEGQLGVIFDTAERYGAKVDIHLHDAGTLGTFELRRIATHTKRRGMEGRVVVSHAFCLGMVDASELAVTADALAAAGVAILTNGPGAAAMPPVKRLRSAGVQVFAGTDNIRDAWSPYGTGDMLERAYMIGQRQSLFADDELCTAFALATTAGAEVLGVDNYEVAVGARANLVAIDAPSVPEAVAAPPSRLLVLHDGRIISELQRSRPQRVH